MRQLQAELLASDAIIDRIDKNAQFRKALDNNEARAAIVQLLYQIIGELDESLKTGDDDAS